MITVADYHPHVLICVKRDRREDEVEDLEALNLIEQAAIMAAIFASTPWASR